VIDRRAARPWPAARSDSRGEEGRGESWATARPRSVIVMVSPAAASATTADAFCLRARIPTVTMFSIVAHSVDESLPCFGEVGHFRRVSLDPVIERHAASFEHCRSLGHQGRNPEPGGYPRARRPNWRLVATRRSVLSHTSPSSLSMPPCTNWLRNTQRSGPGAGTPRT
jgi:hypothetical protein